MDLTAPQAKIDRAVEHLETLRRETEDFIASQPYSVVAEFQPKAGRHVLRLRAREPQDTLIRFSIIAGDLLQNTRAALDHAAWLIACRSQPVEYLWKPGIAGRISFPITQGLKDFRAHKLLAFIADDAKAVLERLQPYHGGDFHDHPLFRLNHLCNIDKHRVLTAGFARLDFSGVTFRRGHIKIEALAAGSEFEWLLTDDTPLEDGAEIAYVRFAEPHGSHVEVGGQMTAQIALGSKVRGFAYSVPGVADLIWHASSALAAIRMLSEEPA